MTALRALSWIARSTHDARASWLGTRRQRPRLDHQPPTRREPRIGPAHDPLRPLREGHRPTAATFVPAPRRMEMEVVHLRHGSEATDRHTRPHRPHRRRRTAAALHTARLPETMGHRRGQQRPTRPYRLEAVGAQVHQHHPDLRSRVRRATRGSGIANLRMGLASVAARAAGADPIALRERIQQVAILASHRGPHCRGRWDRVREFERVEYGCLILSGQRPPQTTGRGRDTRQRPGDLGVHEPGEQHEVSESMVSQPIVASSSSAARRVGREGLPTQRRVVVPRSRRHVSSGDVAQRTAATFRDVLGVGGPSEITFSA